MTLIRHLVPNSMTAASFVLALASIVSSESGHFERAAWLIVWCSLLDIADGVAARMLKATSEFGASLDSFADLAAFGLAPALLVFHLLRGGNGDEVDWWIAGSCALYALAATLRLARFNAIPSAYQHGWFLGLPTTVSGALLALSTIVLLRYEAQLAGIDWPLYLPLVVLGLGIAMVSRLRFPKLRPLRNRLLNAIHIANIVGIYVCGVLRIWPEYLLLSAFIVVGLGLISGLRTTTHG